MRSLIKDLKTFSIFERDRNGNREFQVRPVKLVFGIDVVNTVIGIGSSEIEAIVDAIAHIRILQAKLTDISNELIEFAFNRLIKDGEDICG